MGLSHLEHIPIYNTGFWPIALPGYGRAVGNLTGAPPATLQGAQIRASGLNNGTLGIFRALGIAEYGRPGLYSAVTSVLRNSPGISPGNGVWQILGPGFPIKAHPKWNTHFGARDSIGTNQPTFGAFGALFWRGIYPTFWSFLGILSHSLNLAWLF